MLHPVSHWASSGSTAPYDQADPYSNFVVFQTTFYGQPGSTDFIDEAYHAIYGAGNAQLSNTVSKFGPTSAYFDGTGDWLITKDHADFSFGTGDFCIEAWVFQPSQDTNSPIITKWDASSGIGSWALGDYSGLFRFYFNYTSSFENRYIESSASHATNTWVHIAVSRSAGTITMWQNGSSVGTYSVTTNTLYTSTNNVYIGADTGEHSLRTYTGWIGGMRITKGHPRYTSSFTPPYDAILDPYSNYVVSHIRGVGTDASTTVYDEFGHTVTATGNAQIDTAQFKYDGSSVLFDGTGDYLSMADSADWNFGAGDWTVEFYIRLNSSPGSLKMLVNQWDGGAGQRNFYIGILSSGNIEVGYSTDGTSAGGTSWATGLGTGTWYHIALARVGANLRCFKDGTLIGAAHNIGSSVLFNSTRALEIGGWSYTTPYDFDGWMSNIRITKGVGRYAASFIVQPPVYIDSDWDSTKALLHFNGSDTSTTITDEKGLTWTAAGNAQIDTAQSKFGGSSLLLDGTGDYVYTADNANLELGALNWTMEMYVRFNTLPASTNYFTFFSKWGASGNLTFWWGLYNNSGTYRIDYSFTTDGTNATTRSANWDTPAPVTGYWYHVALVRSGALIYIFLDGKLLSSAACSGTLYNGTADYWIGGNNSTNYLDGWVDEFRWTIGTPRYTTNFIPQGSQWGRQFLSYEPSPFTPASPFSALNDPYWDNVKMLLRADGPADASTVFQDIAGFRTMTAAGNAQTDTTRFKFGGSAILLDGTGDWLSTADSDDFSFGSGDFTLECWVYANSLGAENDILTQWAPSSGVGSWAMVTYSGVPRFYLNYGGTFENRLIIGSITLSTGVWYHMAVTRNGSIIRYFTNGQIIGTYDVGTNSLWNSTQTVYVGANNDATSLSDWDGTIDDVRITKGVCRYNKPFVPPGRHSVTVPLDPYLSSVTMLLHCDGVDGSTVITDEKGHTFTATGNAQVDTAITKFGTGALIFDGTGDEITSANSADYQFGTGDFTVDFWIYGSVGGTYPQVIGLQNTAADDGAWRISNRFNSTNNIHFARGNGTTFDEFNTPAMVSDQNWHHMAAVRLNGVVSLYLDGVFLASSAISGTCSGTNTLRIGYNPRDTAYMTASMDEIRITKGVARYTTNFIPLPREVETPDYNYSSLKALISGDGVDGSVRFYDKKRSEYLTLAGNAQIEESYSKIGGSSMYFDSSGDWAYYADNSDFTMGTGDFCFECWVMVDSAPSSIFVWLTCSNQVSANGLALYFQPTTGYWSCFNYVTTASILISSTAPTTNTWHHAVVNREGSYINLIVNGTLLKTETCTSNFSSNRMELGNDRTNPHGSMNGKIDEFRYYKGHRKYPVFPPGAEHPGNPTDDPYWHYVTLLVHCNGTDASTTFTDSSRYARTLTANGNAQVDTAQLKYGSASLLCDGAGDYVSAPDAAELSFGTNNFTIECFVRFNSTGANQTIISKWTTTGNQREWAITWLTSNNLEYAVSSNGSGVTTYNRSWTPSTGTWYHVAVVRSGSTVKIYIDGTQIGTDISDGTNLYDGTGSLEIGSNTSGTDSFNGWIDEVRITNGVSRYPNMFTPPTKRLPNA